MKIWCQLPVKLPREDPQFSIHYSLMEKHYNLVKRKDTEIAIKDVPTGYRNAEWQKHAGLRFFSHMQILRSVLRAEKEGFDGVSIACFFDPALSEARQLLRIPVTGLAESSMHLACMMGTKFAIITRSMNSVPAMTESIVRYGVEIKAIKRNPVRALTLPEAEVFKIEDKVRQGISGKSGEYSSLLANFKEVAAGCIEDGAEVIIAGCGLLSPVMLEAGLTEVNGAAVVEPLHASLKLTEALVDLYKAKMPFVSRKLSYLNADSKDIAEVLKSVS